MDDKIVPIRLGVAPELPLGGDPEVIREIEGLLSRAQSGDIVGLAYVSLHPGDTTVYHRTGRMTRAVLGALTLLQHAMARADIEEK